MAARVTGDNSDDTHLADDSKRGENAAGSSGYAPPVQEGGRMTGDTSVDWKPAAPKAAPDWKPGYFRAIARKRAMCVFDDAGDGSAGSTVEQAGIGNSEPAASANSLHSADTHRADTHRERRIARDGKAYTWPEFLEYYGESVAANSWNSADIHRAGDGSASSTVSECETATAVATEAQFRDDHTLYVYDRTTFTNPYITDDLLNEPGYFRAIARKRAMCVFDDAGDGSAGRTVEQTGNEDEDPWMCSGVPPPAAPRSVSSSASDSEEEWKLRRKKYQRNDQRHRSASKLCKHLNRRGRCRHGCTPTKTYCHKYQRGQCHRGLDCRYAHS